MAYKDILVHLDGGDRDSVRIAAALSLASGWGARLTGLFARSEYHAPAMVARRTSDGFEAAAEKSERQFAEATKGAATPTRWWRLAHGEPGHVLHETLLAARFHDLVVLGQHHDGKDSPAELAEHLIVQSGRPVLVLPAFGDYPTIGTKVLVGWNGGREATRALHDGLPLIQPKAEVEVLTVRDTHPSGHPQVPPLSIPDHLTQYGITVTREVLMAEDIGIMDMLLSRAFDQGADLLVMGGHGGNYLPFLASKGAGTRHILRHMTLPVLLAN